VNDDGRADSDGANSSCSSGIGSAQSRWWPLRYRPPCGGSAERSPRPLSRHREQRLRASARTSPQREMLQRDGGAGDGIPDAERGSHRWRSMRPARRVMLLRRAPPKTTSCSTTSRPRTRDRAGRQRDRLLHSTSAMDLTPAMDMCVPAGPLRAPPFAPTLDLLELPAAGASASASGESGLRWPSRARAACSPPAPPPPTLRRGGAHRRAIAESQLASKVARGEPAPAKFRGGMGEDSWPGGRGFGAALDRGGRGAGPGSAGGDAHALIASFGRRGSGPPLHRGAARGFSHGASSTSWRSRSLAHAGRIATGDFPHPRPRLAILQIDRGPTPRRTTRRTSAIRDNLRAEMPR